MNFALVLSIFAILAMIFIIIKKPGVLKKDESQPLSFRNFSLKKTFIGDWKKFGTWILLMYLVWSYAHDTQGCREMIGDIDQICIKHMQQLSMANIATDTQLNLNWGENGNTNNSWSRNQSISSDTIP